MSINGGSMYKKAKNKIFRKERRQKHRKNLQSSGISIQNIRFATERLKIFYRIFRNFKKHDSKNSKEKNRTKEISQRSVSQRSVSRIKEGKIREGKIKAKEKSTD